jgi:Protein of unknown function DUF262/Protein of unknown function (DUF1524)
MAEPRSQIAFEELGLGSALKRYRLRVAPNQREYAWTSTEVTRLLQDFAKAINDDGPYFLGTIVTIPRGEGTLEVVDGQQRLATTALLLAAIRDYLKGKGEDLIVQSIDDEFLCVIDRTARSRVPRLALNTDDNELFTNIVTGAGIPDDYEALRASHERLLAARDETRRHVNRVVAPLDELEHGDLLNRWISFLEHRALAVLLKVPDDANAYRMFETLNDRGLRTSQADLIKNYLFSKAGSRINEVQGSWSFMRGALESNTDDPDITIDFLRHALILQNGHLREADVYDATQGIVKSEGSAASFSASLEGLANVYVATFNPENERWNTYPDSVRRAIEVFNLFDIKPMRPTILAVAKKFQPNQAAAAFEFLVTLGVRLIVASSTRSGSVELPLADAARAVYEGTVTTAKELAHQLAGLIPSDGDFETAVETMRVSNAKLARYYLRSLEMTAIDEPEPWFIPQDDKAIINLEHVLPRKLEGNWPGFSDEDVKRLTNRLGNLALLRATDNSGLKSDAFSDKKSAYAASPYVLTTMVADEAAWTAEAIARRQKRLAGLAVKTWPAKA